MPRSVVVPTSVPLAVVAAALLTGTAVMSPAAHAQPAAAKSVRQDFNGDGYEDLATGAPAATVGGVRGAGYVAVVYGSAHGLNPASRKVFTQATPGVPGSPGAGDAFGAHLAAADLDGDGYTDLVVPAAGEGSVTVLWGGARGPVTATALPGKVVDGSARVAVGDFDGDGHADLAGPSTLESGPFTRAGVPARTRALSFTDADVKVLDVASGDVDGDGTSDLVVLTAPFDWDDPGDENVGHSLFYLHGTPDGLAPLTHLQDGAGRDIEGGESIALGDVDGDGRDDLVFGRPRVAHSGDGTADPSEYGERIGIVLGTAHGPRAGDPRTIDQNTAGVPGVTEAGDLFGTDVSVGDVNGDGYADIVAGAPGEDFSGIRDAGTVTVVPGGPKGPTGAGSRVFSQNTPGVPGTAESADGFGEGVTLLDADHDRRADLVVGAPGENANAGSVWAFRSGSAGVTATGSVSFGAGTLGTDPQFARLGREFTR